MQSRAFIFYSGIIINNFKNAITPKKGRNILNPFFQGQTTKQQSSLSGISMGMYSVLLTVGWCVSLTYKEIWG